MTRFHLRPYKNLSTYYSWKLETPHTLKTEQSKTLSYFNTHLRYHTAPPSQNGKKKKMHDCVILVVIFFSFSFLVLFLGMMNLHHRSSQALIGEKYGAAQKEQKKLHGRSPTKAAQPMYTINRNDESIRNLLMMMMSMWMWMWRRKQCNMSFLDLCFCSVAQRRGRAGRGPCLSRSLCRCSDTWARDWRLHLTTVSANMQVSSLVLPSGMSTTYDSRTTVQVRADSVNSFSVVTEL